MEFPSAGDLFLTSAITGVAFLTEIGIFIVLQRREQIFRW